MTWVAVIALAALTFAVAAFALRLPRTGWAVFGAVLMLGLAGYALQGSPSQPSTPKAAGPGDPVGSAMLIESRRALFGADQLPARHVVTADGFARRGRFAEAAEFLTGATAENPQDAEAWVALGNALAEHTGGRLTPAALYAYSRAEQAAPGHPAATYFYGVGLIRSGQPDQAGAVWRELLANAPEDAPWRAELEAQLARLDAMVAQGLQR